MLTHGRCARERPRHTGSLGRFLYSTPFEAYQMLPEHSRRLLLDILEDRGQLTLDDAVAAVVNDRCGPERTRIAVKQFLGACPGIVQTPEGYRLAEG